MKEKVGIYKEKRTYESSFLFFKIIIANRFGNNSHYSQLNDTVSIFRC